ncbi:universal stress protein [Lichenifustis flavocetrariae]|uniref:Universal stress protein n=1 Tax=Lichenifustis flavocetrariae TaxID=2949735 RepID=A0AA41Z3J2_9HYPH|nr:universal stress protein [Lichenifustis flavocetrariae]MCW6512135.1 universal stress protein [Lichenifustis flavocetrariae]
MRALPVVIRDKGVTVTDIEAEAKRTAERSKAAFAHVCEQAGIRSDGKFDDLRTTFGEWDERIGDLEPSVALAGRVCDLIIVNRPTATNLASELIFDAAVFATGRPTLVLSPKVPDNVLRHVVIAWNGSLEATRLIGHSLDLLHAADRVSIITADRSGSAAETPGDLANYLMWHGIRAHPLSAVSESNSVPEAILAGASKGEATMLLMGAYTHSRIRQFLLGGVTRHVLENSEIPVLMEH